VTFECLRWTQSKKAVASDETHLLTEVAITEGYNEGGEAEMGEGAAVGRGSVGLRKERSPSAVVHQTLGRMLSEKVGVCTINRQMGHPH